MRLMPTEYVIFVCMCVYIYIFYNITSAPG